MRLRLLVAVLVAFFVGAAPGTTTATAPSFSYDVPAIARVDVQPFGYAEASPAQASGSREWSASPSVQARGASTTRSGSFIATEAANPGSRAIVIGEDMEGRVIPKAQELGADYYDPPTAPRDQWMENNRQWINDRMDEGCTIYDCGAAPGRANYPSPTSPYYQMELDQIAKRSYPTIKVS